MESSSCFLQGFDSIDGWGGVVFCLLCSFPDFKNKYLGIGLVLLLFCVLLTSEMGCGSKPKQSEISICKSGVK